MSNIYASRRSQRPTCAHRSQKIEMRHRISLRKLGRNSKERMTLFKNLVSNLVKHERIVTTLPKGKELRRISDKVVTLGKKDTPYAHQEVKWWMREPPLIDKVFKVLKYRYEERPGGYTRVLRIPNREGDKAPMAVVELVDNPLPPLRPSKEEYLRQKKALSKNKKDNDKKVVVSVTK
uniref:Large ribosomal subunit protein bL17m n=2 Tax=Amphimedon queenslandica TaxID=400682 RepID=A0A1X7V167_AMPQE